MKARLFAPGPTLIPERLHQAMRKPELHHKSEFFRSLFDSIQKKLQKMLNTDVPVILESASGSGAMEMCLANLASHDSLIITINAGPFGARWKKITDALSLQASEFSLTPGAQLNLTEFEAFLQQFQNVDIFCLQHCETSTASLLPVVELSRMVKSKFPDCLIILDAISTFATCPVDFVSLPVDVIIFASQKGLMLPPGLAGVGLNQKALQRSKLIACPSFYWSFDVHLKNYAKDANPWTPPISLLLGLNEALAMLEEEGLQNVFKRHELMAKGTRAALSALGFELFSRAEPSTAVTAAIPPTPISPEDLRRELYDNFGVYIAGGQAEMEDKIIRVGHMGFIDLLDIYGVIGAIESAVITLGAKQGKGAGLSALLTATT